MLWNEFILLLHVHVQPDEVETKISAMQEL